MSILLDSKTIMLSLGGGYLFALILVVAYWNNRTNASYANAFIGAKFTQTLAWYAFILRGSIPDLVSVSLANSALLIATLWEVIVLMRLQEPLHQRIKLAYLTMAILGIAGFVPVSFTQPEFVRIAYCSAVMPLILAPACRLVWRRSSTMLMRFMGLLYLLFIVVNVSRGTAALHAADWTSFYTPSAYQPLIVAGMIIVIVLGNTGFVLLLKERDNQDLLRLASYDDLTGALNRRTFTSRAERLLAMCAGKGQAVSYLLFDIDNFKAINDTYGHHAGDLVLQNLTAAVEPHLSRTDLFVRYGGDEFGILLPGMDESESSELAERIQHSLAATPELSLPTAYTISIGLITVVPGPATRLELLYTSCDKALYAAKRNGRNGIARGQTTERNSVLA
ncbi:GGDEF domain-containing protein [Paenibacillus lycopersici]|uniref:GGDEF domain-containing protein n=1 Tax=Paenibacillus lycopersici TaxID=2704462 RepID=A0A6C0FNV3_9BACL|nr:GGDEF domain-containing protein [Paenibacillus lycopersici]QHT58788.1 GGDEF domain-containing protein [Paenibacillus lycopersici]